MNKYIITHEKIKMQNREEQDFIVAALYNQGKKMIEVSLTPPDEDSLLGNIYIGRVENVVQNIRAAFVKISPEQTCYLSLDDLKNAHFTKKLSAKKEIVAGDELLVQVSRDAMKGKLPALTSNLNFTGRYLVLTTGDKKFGLSSKLSLEDRHRLSGWLREEAERPEKEFGIIVRTNAADASKEEILKELEWLKGRYHKAVVQGRNRTCFSLVLETEPFYVAAVRDAYGRDLDEIITDVPEIGEMIQGYLEEISPELKEKFRFYQDKLLPLYKLYRVETALDAIQKEKVWLNSGGFLVIQQTEAFVSIDVNSGKYTGKKKMEETFRKINLEAAAEISRQLRLRNLSGIILIDFINMENPDHREELFHVLQKLLRKDPIKSRAIDITPLHILEMTRKKVRRPVIEDIRELTKK